jgi:hypothetical protein
MVAQAEWDTVNKANANEQEENSKMSQNQHH